jgi:hypothetical protein
MNAFVGGGLVSAGASPPRRGAVPVILGQAASSRSFLAVQAARAEDFAFAA